MGDFAARIATQEWWSSFGFWVLVAGLAGDIVVLVIPEHRRLLEKLLSGFFVVVIIVGCAFESVAENRISDLISQEEALAGARVAEANNEAATANGRTADLAGKFGGLKNLVGTTETKIAGEMSDFQKRTAADMESAKQTITGAKDTIAELNRDRADLTKARDETEAAEKKAEAVVAAAAAANAPRTLLPKQQDDLVAKLKALPGLTANLLIPPSTSPDTGPLATLLQTLLEKAGWKVGLMQTLGGWSKMVLVCTGKSPSPKVVQAATTIVLELRAAGMQSFVDEEMGPFIPATGAGNTLEKPDMTIVVGSKQ